MIDSKWLYSQVWRTNPPYQTIKHLIKVNHLAGGACWRGNEFMSEGDYMVRHLWALGNQKTLNFSFITLATSLSPWTAMSFQRGNQRRVIEIQKYKVELTSAQWLGQT